MKHESKILSLTACVTIAATAVQAQYYGIVDNFQGLGRYPAEVNLTSKDGATVNNFNFSGGGGGFGAGDLADGGPLGTGDSALNGGGSLGAGGFAGHSLNMNTAIDLTAVSNGRSNTDLVFDFQDLQNDGDVWTIRLDTPDFTNSRTFTIPVSDGNWNSYSFDYTSDGVVAGSFDPTAIVAIVLTPSSDTGDFAFSLDNVGFTGNYAPISGAVEDFQGYAAASLGAGGGALAQNNNFDGVVESFSFGGGSVDDTSLVDLGAGNIAVQYTFGNTEGGVAVDLGLPGAQADLSAFDAISFDLSVSEAGDEVAVLVEDINARDFADRCSFTPAATTTVQNFVVPFGSLVCGAQNLTESVIHRVSFVPITDQGNGITFTVDNIQFVNTASGIEDWNIHTR